MSNYQDYLSSSKWQKKRKDFLESRAEPNKCLMCKCYGPVDIHHNTYKNVGDENRGDLSQLCRECHELLHSHCQINNKEKNRIPKKLGKKWTDKCNRDKLWDLRDRNPQKFKRLALKYLSYMIKLN